MPSLDEAREKLRQLEQLTAKLRQAVRGGPPRGIEEQRAADRARKLAVYRAAAAVQIPRCENPARRKRLERDCFRWLRYYLPDVFTEPWQPHQLAMGRAILAATVHAGDQAIAAPRGEGKTTICEGVVIYCILTGRIAFAVIFAATAADAGNSLAAIKQYLAESDRLLADYPEVCVPIRECHASPQRAHTMLVTGEGYGPTFARFQWSGEEISLPAVPGSRCAGALIATRGLDCAVRGLKKGRLRPQLAVIDDPDTEDTARSPAQAKKLEERIDRAIAGLAPMGKRLSRVMLTTIQNRICVSFRFTDPSQKPSWNGQRFSFLVKPPERKDLWEEYVAVRREAQRAGDRYARAAHRFYLARRKEMDAGGQVCNPRSFDGRTLEDGSRLQVSAVQRYYDFLADNGAEAAASELQNAPEEARGPLALTAAIVARKLSGLARGTVPKEAQYVSAYLDVHDRLLYYVVSAWTADFGGGPIDYGTYPGQPVAYFAEASAPVSLADRHAGPKEARIAAGLEKLAGELLERVWQREDGAAMRIGRLLIDSGYLPEVVGTFCRRHPKAALLLPAKGLFVGPASRPMAEYRAEPGALVGHHWRVPPPKVGSRERYCLIDTNYWKSFAGARLALAVGARGGWELWGRDPRAHELFSDHCVSEEPVWTEARGRGLDVWTWRPGRPDNHYWDCLVGSAAAGCMLGAALAEWGVVRRRRGQMVIQH